MENRSPKSSEYLCVRGRPKTKTYLRVRSAEWNKNVFITTRERPSTVVDFRRFVSSSAAFLSPKKIKSTFLPTQTERRSTFGCNTMFRSRWIKKKLKKMTRTFRARVRPKFPFDGRRSRISVIFFSGIERARRSKRRCDVYLFRTSTGLATWRVPRNSFRDDARRRLKTERESHEQSPK